MQRWIFEIAQGGMVVASGEAPDRGTALREAGHYVQQYGQDGEAEAIVRKPGDRAGLAARKKLLDGQSRKDVEK